MRTSYGDINYDENEVLNLGANYLDNDTNGVELHLLTELSENSDDDDDYPIKKKKLRYC